MSRNFFNTGKFNGGYYYFAKEENEIKTVNLNFNETETYPLNDKNKDDYSKFKEKLEGKRKNIINSGPSLEDIMKECREKELAFFKEIMGEEYDKYDKSKLQVLENDYYTIRNDNGYPFYYTFLSCVAKEISTNEQEIDVQTLINFLKKITTRTFYDKGLKQMTKSLTYQTKAKIINAHVIGRAVSGQNEKKIRLELKKKTNNIGKLVKEIIDLYFQINWSNQKNVKEISPLQLELQEIIFNYYEEAQRDLYEVGALENFFNVSQVQSLFQEEALEKLAKMQFIQALENVLSNNSSNPQFVIDTHKILKDNIKDISDKKIYADVKEILEYKKNLKSQNSTTQYDRYKISFQNSKIQYYKSKQYQFQLSGEMIEQSQIRKNIDFPLTNEQLNELTQKIQSCIQEFIDKTSISINLIKKVNTQNTIINLKGFIEQNLEEKEKKLFEMIWSEEIEGTGIDTEINNITDNYLNKRLLPFINLLSDHLLVNDDKIEFDPTKPFKNSEELIEIQTELINILSTLVEESDGDIKFKEVPLSKNKNELERTIKDMITLEWLNKQNYSKKQIVIIDNGNQINGERTEGKNLITDFMSKFYGSIGEIIFSLILKKITQGTVTLAGNSRNSAGEEAHTDIFTTSNDKDKNKIGFQSKQLLTYSKFGEFGSLGTIYGDTKQMKLDNNLNSLKRYDSEYNIHILRQLALLGYTGILNDEDNKDNKGFKRYYIPAARIIDYSFEPEVKNYFYIGNGFLYPTSYLLYYNLKPETVFISEKMGAFANDTFEQNITGEDAKNLLSKSYFTIKFSLYPPNWKDMMK